MQALHLTRVEDYRRQLNDSPAEWEELLETLVVAETWFFRDRRAFAELNRLALTQLANCAKSRFPKPEPDASSSTSRTIRAHPFSSAVSVASRSQLKAAPLRLLSVPCATGEEPYSLAMTLLDAGLTQEQFHLDAADISPRAIAAAERAVYGCNSFRGDNLAFRARHFRALGNDRFELTPQVRGCVQFHCGNLLDPTFMAKAAPYDFIFCRNVLIYFDRTTQACALRHLSRLLADDGHLFLGPAELPLAVQHDFASLQLPMAFACRKTANNTSSARLNARSPESRFDHARSRVSTETPLRGPGFSRSGRSPSVRPPDALPVASDTLAAAQRLADAGQFPQAAALCHAHLQRHGANAQAYCLLGFITEAQGQPGAAEYYRRALYLEPEHCAALRQMAQLCTRQGDTARARLFLRRAVRAQSRT